MDIKQRIKDNEDVSLYDLDCMELMSNMDENSVEMTLTDIPYDALNDLKGTKREKHKGAMRKNSKEDADVMTFDLNLFLAEIIRITKGSIYVFCSTEQVSQIRSFFIKEGLSTRLGVWEKSNPSPANGEHLWLSGVEVCIFARKKNAPFNQHCKNSVWKFPIERGEHPTPKPVRLNEYLINSSSNKGDIIFDPCMGGGSSGVAAVITGRKYIGTDINKNYYKIAMQRICHAIEKEEQKLF